MEAWCPVCRNQLVSSLVLEHCLLVCNVLEHCFSTTAPALPCAFCSATPKVGWGGSPQKRSTGHSRPFFGAAGSEWIPGDGDARAAKVNLTCEVQPQQWEKRRTQAEVEVWSFCQCRCPRFTGGSRFLLFGVCLFLFTCFRTFWWVLFSFW